MFGFSRLAFVLKLSLEAKLHGGHLSAFSSQVNMLDKQNIDFSCLNGQVKKSLSNNNSNQNWIRQRTAGQFMVDILSKWPIFLFAIVYFNKYVFLTQSKRIM